MPATLGISHTFFILIILLFLLPMVIFTVWRITSSISAGMIVTFGAVLTLTFMGIFPVWICVVFGIFAVPLAFYNLSMTWDCFGGTENNTDKVLCKFIKNDGRVIEKWSDGNTVEFEGYYQFFINKSQISNEQSNGKVIKTIRYMESEMTNQLIQDPKKSLKDITNAGFSISTKVSMDTSPAAIPTYKPILRSSIVDNTLGFKSIGFDRGVKIATKLDTTHRQILSIFDNDIFNGANSLVDVDKIKKLELDLYNQGINVLKQVYEIATQLQQSKIDELQLTNKELNEQLNSLDKNKTGMFNLIQDRLEINNKSLGMIKKYNDKIDELICQVELYIDSIGEMCLELPELMNHKAQDDMDKTLKELNERIAVAQRIKDEYVKEGL